jgi:hypothetical protein
MIWKKNKIIFIHIPKCGGTSIENSINVIEKGMYWGQNKMIAKKINFFCELQHMPYLSYLKLVKDINDFYTFCFVRNPFDRAISLYKDAKYKRHDIKKKLNLKDDFNFNEFLKKIKDSNHIHHKNQTFFLNDKKNNKIKVFKFENFEKNFIKVLTQNKISTKLRKSNQSKKGSIIESKLKYYNNKENINLVKAIFKDDLRTFDYSYKAFEKSQKNLFFKKVKNFLIRKINNIKF